MQKRYLIILVCATLIFGCTSGSRGSDAAGWHRLDTKYTTICYQSENDLRELLVRIGGGRSLFRVLLWHPRRPDLEESTAERVDRLFERTQEILDMKGRFKKTRILVLKDRKQLKDTYSRLFKGTCSLKAWYWHKDNTIYINARDVHQGVLAHEFAHAIVYNYLKIRPPRASAEILARYVDSRIR